jgi:hypothetical protein
VRGLFVFSAIYEYLNKEKSVKPRSQGDTFKMEINKDKSLEEDDDNELPVHLEINIQVVTWKEVDSDNDDDDDQYPE